MNNRPRSKSTLLIALGLLIGMLSLGFMVGAVKAESVPYVRVQGTTPTPTTAPTETLVVKECIECHPDKRDTLIGSPHAHAYDNPTFQEGWASLDHKGECLLCHTTGYQEATGEYIKEGVSCEACHGAANPQHPAVEYPVRSEKESCGTCHPAILNQTQLSGHTKDVDAGCVNCHDPHSQKPLFENPDNLCKECHKEDLAAMDKVLSDLHLRENITCASCHTLDVPHTFLYNVRQEDVTSFMTGFDCPAEIGVNVALQVDAQDETQSTLETKMNWPTVHKVSRAKAALKCDDCHEMNEKTRSDFKALGYSDEDLNKLSWEDGNVPTVTEQDVDLLVARPRSGWSWVFWLIGAVSVFGVFEFFVTRRLKKQKVEEESKVEESKDEEHE